MEDCLGNVDVIRICSAITKVTLWHREFRIKGSAFLVARQTKVVNNENNVI